MKDLNFLKKIKRQGQLGLVEPSEDIKKSYLIDFISKLTSDKIKFYRGGFEDLFN